MVTTKGSNNLFISMNSICKQQVMLKVYEYLNKGRKRTSTYVSYYKIDVIFILFDHPSAWCMLSLLKMRSGSGLAVLT